MKQTYKLTGLRPFLMHNGRLADPLHPLSKQLRKLSGLKSKTDDTHAQIAEVEWEGGLWWDDRLGLHIPSAAIEAMLIQGGARQKKKGHFKAGVFVDADPGIAVETQHARDLAKLRANPGNRMRCGVVVQRGRIMRTRPLIPSSWVAVLPLQIDESLLNESEVFDTLELCGRSIGLGDWRPKFGRFTVTRI